MAAITLRDYVREIEKQVDGSRNEEAIAHSRHVLESFPKHVDVYRLLGKAYLESQRYGDAGDIFQRVLSAVPEDFVSHVGMSIIREDEGNLDEAIWHMERAFDVQPSNGAIQEELRRLYGRRDNVEPPKIRLTRGALARMYFKGELYPQAIAELRAALNENPERLDLQALLAEVYARARQRVEAVDVASQVLRRLPFCLEANQIMMEMLIGSDRESEIETYYQRLCQLDPYTAHVNAAAPRAADVPDQAIRLTKLDYKSSQATDAGPGQPVWAATLGIEAAEMATGQEETLPEWLAAGPSTLAGESGLVEGGQVPAFAGDEAQLAAEEQIVLLGAAGEEEQIPDWMKEMGWGPAGPVSQIAEAAIPFDEEEAPVSEGGPPEGELAAAEIPDWLKAMAPAGALAEAAAEEESEEDVAPWLDQLFAAEPPGDEAADLEKPAFLEAAEKPEDEIQPWLGAGLALGTALVGSAVSSEDETLESAEPLEAEALSFDESVEETLLEDQQISALDELEAPEELAGEQAPDWLAEIALADELVSAETSDELPDWLRESLAPAAEPAAEAVQPEDLGGWSFEETPSEELPGGEIIGQAAAEEGEELPGWLFESGAAEAALPEAAAEIEEELPGWLFESEATDETLAETTAEIKEDLPDWLFEAATVEGAGETAEQGAEGAEGIPDWLKAAGAVAGGAAAFQTAEWLSEEEEPEEAIASLAVELEEEMEEPEPVEALLAEELPEWLREPADLVGAVTAEETILPTEEAVIPVEAVQIETVSPEAQAIAPVENPELAEALAWLDLMLTPVEEDVEAAAPEAPPLPKETAPGAEQLMDEDAAFAWLESLAARQGAQEALLLKPEERLETPPEWVLQAAQEAGEAVQAEAVEGVEEAPEVQAVIEAPSGEDADFAWLESLAVRQGAQEALLLKPEERQETPPEWVTAAGVAVAAGLVAEKAQEEEPLAEQEIEAQLPEPVEVAAETVEAVETTGGAQEIVSEPVAPEPPVEEVEAPPELPDWLAAPSSETREETLEWTPPPLSRRKYDLNKITLVEMERLPGIGFIMAQRIIDYRNTHGQFKQIDDLLNVPEFGMAALEGIRENLYLEVPPEPPSPPARTPTQPRPGTGPLVLATGAGLPKEVAKAREHLSKGYIEPALDIYDELIRSKKHLSWVVEDLSEASNQYSAELYVWQSLGDAYLRSDQPSQALQAYIRAEKLLLQ